MDYKVYKTFRDRKEYKDTQATVRQTEYDSLTVQSKLDMLDKRLGVGIGAKKQRTKLITLL